MFFCRFPEASENSVPQCVLDRCKNEIRYRCTRRRFHKSTYRNLYNWIRYGFAPATCPLIPVNADGENEKDAQDLIEFAVEKARQRGLK